MSAPSNTHIFRSDFAAFTVAREHVCIDEEEEKEPPPPWIYGTSETVGLIENPRVMGSLANVFDRFVGRITVVGPELNMHPEAVVRIARCSKKALDELAKWERSPTKEVFAHLQEANNSFMQSQVRKGLVFFFHDATKMLENLKDEGRVVIVGPNGVIQKDTRADQAYRMALHYLRKLDEYPNEKALGFFFEYALDWEIAQIETGLTYLFCHPPRQDPSSLSLSASSSSSSSCGMVPSNS